MAAAMMPAVTRPAGVVRSVALSRLRLPRRSFTFALIFDGSLAGGLHSVWPGGASAKSSNGAMPASPRAMAAPTWFERASLHAAVISAASCRLPAQGPDPRGSTSCVCRQLLSRSWCAGAYLIVLERGSPCP